MSLCGWIVVHAAPGLDLAAARVVAGSVAGRLGQAIPSPPELVAVAIELTIRVECVAIDARINVVVPVTPARTTVIELPATQIVRCVE